MTTTAETTTTAPHASSPATPAMSPETSTMSSQVSAEPAPARPEAARPEAARPETAEPERDWPVLAGAGVVALIATSSAYVAMTGFATDILGIDHGQAYAFAGVFELTMIVLALLARNRARRNRPARTRLGLTWVMAAASGCFSALHEVLALGHGPVAAAFRFSVPLLAALLWHYVLTDERESATERSWTAMREDLVMHLAFDRSERWWRAQVKAAKTGRRRDVRAAERANRARLRSARRARRVVPPERMPARIDLWSASAARWNSGDRAVGEGVLYETAHTDSVVADLETINRTELAITTGITQTVAQALTQPRNHDRDHAALAQRDADQAAPRSTAQYFTGLAQLSRKNPEAAQHSRNTAQRNADPRATSTQQPAQDDDHAAPAQPRADQQATPTDAPPTQRTAQRHAAPAQDAAPRNTDSATSPAQTHLAQHAATQPPRSAAPDPAASHTGAGTAQPSRSLAQQESSRSADAATAHDPAEPVAQPRATTAHNGATTTASRNIAQPAAQVSRTVTQRQIRPRNSAQRDQRPPAQRGARRSVRARVRDEVDVVEVHLRREAGESYESIARAMGFSRDTVRRAHRAAANDVPETPAHGIDLAALQAG